MSGYYSDECEPRYTREQYNQYKGKLEEIDFRQTQELYPEKCVMCKGSVKYQHVHVAGCKHAYCADCFTYLEDSAPRHVNGGPPLGYSCKECKNTIKSIKTFKAKKDSLPKCLTSKGILWKPIASSTETK